MPFHAHLGVCLVVPICYGGLALKWPFAVIGTLKSIIFIVFSPDENKMLKDNYGLLRNVILLYKFSLLA